MHRLWVVGYLGLLLLIVALVTRPGAQTQPVGGPTSFGNLTVGGTLTGNTWVGTSTMSVTAPGINVLRFIGGGVQIMTINSTNDSPWNFSSGGALTGAGSSASIVMATTTIFNASGTLQNNACNFNDLNLLIPNAGQQCYCGNCAVGATCASGGTGAMAKRIGGGVAACT